MQIELEKTLDVAVVEGQLAKLWKEIAGEGSAEGDTAVLRARVANLLVFVAEAELLDEVQRLLGELTPIHPSRVLLMLGARDQPDRDIEMSVESFCQSDKRGRVKRLCCEEVTLKARGRFTAELPSVALPLLVSDLSTFLWWRDVVRSGDKVFNSLLRAADRLVIDSAEFADTRRDLNEVNELFAGDQSDNCGISDLNWARLTFWRGLLADFYDVPAYRKHLIEIDRVRIDYVGPGRSPEGLAPQALLMAGWLASRLEWQLTERQPAQASSKTTSLICDSKDGREIILELNRVERAERKPGRLVRVELRSSGEATASFTVERSADNLHLQTEAKLGTEIQRGRVLPVRNRSAAQLLSREMEILCNDQVYQEAVAMAARMISPLL